MTPTIRLGTPEVLFERTFVGWMANEGRSYDVVRDGRFLMLQETEHIDETPAIIVVLNWYEELKNLLPTN